MTKILQDLNLVPLEERRRAKRLCMMYKIVNQLVGIPTDEHLTPAQTRTRGSPQHKFQVPSARTNIYKYSYFPRTINDWNSLEEEIVRCPSLDSFKGALQCILPGFEYPHASASGVNTQQWVLPEDWNRYRYRK